MNEAGLHVENLSWEECESALTRFRVVMIPIGAALKEHGRHLPLNNDETMARTLAERVTARTPVLTTPPISYGYYPAFTEYPGSVGLREQTFLAVLEDVVHAWMRYGVKKFYFLNTGISTVPALEKLQAKMRSENVQIEFTDLRRDGQSAVRALEQQPRGTHADEIETSMMLELAPQTVRMNLAVAELNEDKGPGGLTRDSRAATGVYSKTGAWGDPTLATKEKGKVIVDALIVDIVQSIDRLRAADARPVEKTDGK